MSRNFALERSLFSVTDVDATGEQKDLDLEKDLDATGEQKDLDLAERS